MTRPFLLHQLLWDRVQAQPDAPLLLDGERTYSYQDIGRQAEHVAAVLLNLGVKRGDRVAVVAKNSPFYIASYYGTMAAGAVLVGINTSATADNIAFYLADSGASIVLVGSGFDALVTEALPGVGHVCQVLRESALQEAGASLPFIQPNGIDQDLAAIVYTSGSTGRPRGVTLAHRNIVCNTDSIVAYLGLTAADRVGVVLPFFYAYGASVLNTHVQVGGSLVLEHRSAFPNVVLDTLERTHCTGFSAVPSTYAILLARSNLRERHLPALRYLTQAGAAMSKEQAMALQQAVPHAKLYMMYGATEASARLTYLDPAELPRKLGSIGKAIANVRVDVFLESGERAPANAVGEIVASGSNLMQGYWNDPAETAAVLSPLGYHTGDLGYRDEDGFLFVVGRKKDMLKIGAHRVASKEIEEAIAAFAGVMEAAVVAMPDEVLGEAPKAFVVWREASAADTKALMAFLKMKLASYKLPKHIIVMSDLPKSAAGKIDKRALAATP